MDDSVLSAAFSDTEEDGDTTSGEAEAAVSTSNYYQVLDGLDDDSHLN